MNQHQAYVKSWLISFGVIDLPDSIRSAIPGFIKKDTPATEIKKTRKFLNEEKRQVLLENIELALKEKIFESIDIWEFILRREKETGQEILLRNRYGGLMADATFISYIVIQRRSMKVRKPSVRDKVIRLHSEGLSDIDIGVYLNCTQEHIRRCLIDAGLIEKTTPAKRKSSGTKRKSY